MRHQIVTLSLALALSATAVAHAAGRDNDRDDDHRRGESSVQLGPRPFFLVNGDANVVAELPTLSDLVGYRNEGIRILGVFSDWTAPVTFYANCMGLR